MTFQAYEDYRAAKQKALTGTAPSTNSLSLATFSATVGTSALTIAILYTITRLVEMKADPSSPDKDDLARKEIQYRLEELEKRLVIFLNDLDTIRSGLVARGILIDLPPAEIVLQNLRSTIDAILDSYSEWLLDPTSSSTQAQIRQSIADLRKHTRTLSQRGFAPCLDVFFGLIFELDLSVLNGLSSTRIERSIQLSLAYIDACSDPASNGSIAEYLTTIQRRLLTLSNQASNIPINQRVYLGQEVFNHCCGDGVIEIMTYYCKVVGTLQAGFEVRYESEFDLTYCSCDSWRNLTVSPQAKCDCDSNSFVEAKTSRTEAFGAIAKCPHNQRDLDRMHREYLRLKREEAFLQKFLQQLSELRSAIEARFAWQAQFKP